MNPRAVKLFKGGRDDKLSQICPRFCRCHQRRERCECAAVSQRRTAVSAWQPFLLKLKVGREKPRLWFLLLVEAAPRDQTLTVLTDGSGKPDASVAGNKTRARRSGNLP